MSGDLIPKVRVVRCPKCRLLLPEPPGYDVYKCGGCGTALQAKKRKNVAVNSESSIPETDRVSKGEKLSNREHVVPSHEDSLESKATTSSSSSGECYLDGKVGRDNGQYNGDQLVPVNLSDGQELESELDTYQLSHRRRRLSQKGRSDNNTHSEIEEINNGNLSEGSKEELICGSEEDGNSYKSAQIELKSEMEITEGDLEGSEELRSKNLSLEGAEEGLVSESDGEDANNDKTTVASANPQVEITRSDLEGAEELNHGNQFQEGEEEKLSSEMDGEDAKNEKSTLVGDNLEVETNGSNRLEELNNGKLSIEGADHNNDQSGKEGAKSEVKTTKTASTIKSSSIEKGSISHVTPNKVEEGTSGNHVSFTKQQKNAQKNVHLSSDHVRSVDKLDTTELVNPSSELSDILGKFSNSPTARSSYAYDGSLSSYDGREERFPIQHLDSFENTRTASNGVSDGRTRRGKGLVTHHSHLSNGRHCHLQNKVLEATRHGHRDSMRTKRDEFPPRIPFHRSSSHSLYERGSSSNQMHDKHYFRSSFLSPDSYEDTDQEKMKLLTMIQNLQNQLNRTRYASGETNGRYEGNHISSYHSHDLHDRRFSHGMDYMCNRRCTHGINWHQRHKFPRIPYSSEATCSAHNSCFYCSSSQERHFSAEIPSHPHGRCTDCYSSNHSYSSSPQYFTSSKLPIYGLDTKSDDQRQRVSEIRKYVREKQNLAKRHHKPVAGGAPFVTCHKCLKLLEIPSDFLIYRKLKCGECSEVLKFSVQNGRHIVSLGIPSSELNNATSTSHANYYQYSQTEAISCFDDYGIGISVSNSYSSEVDPVSMTQFHHLHGSRKLSSEIEPKSSSLHKLMGYSSPSQVIRGKVRRSYSVEKESHDSLQRKDQE